MKIYQIIPSGETFPVLYQSEDVYDAHVHEYVKDFIKLEDNIYATFHSDDADSPILISRIPDNKMIEGKLEYFNVANMDENHYIVWAKQRIIPFWKKIQFDNNMKNL